MKWYNALIEFYLSLIAYYVLHMIFVISSDFVEAFSIPPLNIGIYVDKLAAIRALLMVLADFIEWRVLDKALGDAGKANKALSGNEKSPRRIGSIVSFFIMLFCRLHYLWIVYFSDNKSLIAFVNLCIEGFWFGVFQMSFFAIGPEYNAFTSFGIHTMGNFIFFLQVILQREAKKKPKINCLYRVRVHAWIVVITSIIAISLWIYFCYSYSLGGGDSLQFESLVCMLKEDVSVTQTTAGSPEEIAKKLANKMKTATVTNLKDALSKCEALKTKIEGLGVSISDATKISQALGGTGQGTENVAKLLVKGEFGYDPGNLTGNLTGENNTVTVDIGIGSENSDPRKVNVSITGSSDGNTNFTGLVGQLSTLATTIKNHIDNLGASEIKNALNNGDTVKQKINALIDGAGVDSVTVSGNNDEKKVTVSVTGSGETKTASVEMTNGEKTVEVEFKVTADQTNNQHIASLLALAMVHNDVKNAVKEQKYELRVKGGVNDKVTIQVNQAKSKAQANRIAFKLGKTLTAVNEITKSLKDESIKVQVSINHEPWMIPGDSNHVWSPLLLFIVGAFAEDFAVPGILPFAFLDPDKASLVNYLTPSFFMTGAWIVVLVNDFFEFKGFTSSLGISHFKEWSEGAQPEWNAVWLLNIPKYIAFFIAMWSIHGTYDSLRCIIQSRWRVMLLTMIVVVPRATLEVMGYVGVANYAIFASDTNDFGAFDYIAYHDMLAMFCRFVYGKFAVGYNSTLISLITFNLRYNWLLLYAMYIYYTVTINCVRVILK